jgi:hypothetical protein
VQLQQAVLNLLRYVMRKMRAGSLPDLVRMAERLGIACRRQADTKVSTDTNV